MSEQTQPQSSGNIPPEVVQKYDEELVNPPPEKDVNPVSNAEL